jgi:Ca-activated chloride channel family protein
MTDNDDQLDKQIREGLNGDIPPPDPDAKRRAIAMARAEFVAEHAQATEKQEEKESQKSPQGILRWLRLIVGNNADKEGDMIPYNQKLIYSGVAAAAVAAVAVGITLQIQQTDFNTSGVPELVIPSEQDVAEEVIVTGVRRTETEREVAANEPSVVDEYRAQEVKRERADKDDAALGGSVAAPAEEMMIAEAAAPMPATRQAPAKAKLAEGLAYSSADAARGIVAPPDVIPAPGYQDVGRDKFEEFEQNNVKLVSEEPVSTFSVDVDTASYSFVRRMLNQGVLPQSDAVRAEELINYFDYDYALPETKAQPFQPSVAVVDSPWAEGRQLMRIGIKGYDIPASEKPRTNLVFLLDVSGSMNSPDKLPLVKQSMEMLLSTLNPDDTVAIAVYAGAAGTILEPTPVKEKQKILNAMHQLSAGGSTAGAQGIRLAYELAESQFDKDAINRVILATDGDFNVGITNQRELQSFIERKRDKGIFLSVLGFGQGNYQDALMQTLAQNGNGVAAYIDTLSEAQKVLVDEASSTLFPIAKDVKIQVEFNPATVAEYRLIGYETRHLNREDFNNDAVDAGDIGAGHTVTAIYEFTPVGSDARQIEESRYAPKMQKLEGKGSEYAFLKMRYKLPEEDTSKLITRPITKSDVTELEGDTGFATAVAGFAQVLKGGKYTGDFDYDDIIELAQNTKGQDAYGYRSEFVQLVRKAKTAAAMQKR